jgi:hypothetical protein
MGFHSGQLKVLLKQEYGLSSKLKQLTHSRGLFQNEILLKNSQMDYWCIFPILKQICTNFLYMLKYDGLSTFQYVSIVIQHYRSAAFVPLFSFKVHFGKCIKM